MARQLVVFLLVLFATLAYAAEPAPAATGAATASAPTSNDDIGVTDDDSAAPASGDHDDVTEAPVGGPVPDGTFAASSPTESPNSGTSALGVSAVAGVSGAVAGFFFFF